ncbi:MAG: gliding motility-associated C-terminal domain-containing protein [Flavobacterium sp.]
MNTTLISKIKTRQHQGKCSSIQFKQLLLLLVFFLSGQAFSQFSVSMTAVNESCTSNGVLNWSVSGTTSGSTIVYSIYKAPNYTTAIATTSPPTSSLTGLSAGSYRIVATQTVSGVPTSAQANATITDTRIALNYTATTVNAGCTNNGSITVNLTSGRQPVTYALTGPVNYAAQSSNVFTGLSGGNYNVIVTDACGESKVVTYSISQYTPNIQITQVGGSTATACGYLNVPIYISAVNSGSAMYMPIQVQVSATPPGGGAPVVTNSTFTSTSSVIVAPTDYLKSISVPYWPQSVPYSYTITFTDACGNVFTYTKTMSDQLSMALSAQTGNCGGKYIDIDTTGMTHPITFTITNAPAGYAGPTTATSNDGYGHANFGSASSPLPDGSYTIQAVDACGNTVTKTITLTSSTVAQSFYADGSCRVGYSNFYLYGASAYLVSATVLSYTAPAAFPGNVFPHPLPYDATSHISNYGTQVNNRLYFGDYPAGTYVIRTTDNCGITRTQTVTPGGYTRGTVNITENYFCSAFSVNLAVSGSGGTNNYQKYYLQKFYPASNKWGHPTSGTLYNETGDPGSSGLLISSVANPNLTSALISNNFGTFRVIKVYQSTFTCKEVLKEFTYTLSMSLDKAFVYACANGTYNLGISASGGVPALGYRIIAPTLIENGTNSLFTGLAAGTYTVQVYDSCGNTLNKVLDIVMLGLPTITPVNLCPGENGQLVVNGASYLNFQWYNNANPSVILSTTNSLNFANFTPVNSAGTYSVHLTSSVGSSCINETLSFTISVNPSNPQAGNDVNELVCDYDSTINLNHYLSGTYDNYGTWTEITNSGLLSGNIWSSELAPVGTYQFKYTVNGQCSGVDEAIITLSKEDCPPVIEANDDTSTVCVNGSTGGNTNFNVLTNDNTFGNPLDPSDVVITSTPTAFLTVNANGSVTVAPNTPAGTYTINYTICFGSSKTAQTNRNKYKTNNQVNAASYCDSAIVTVCVTTIDAVNDGPTNINGIPGGSTPSVLANDTVNGSTPATTSNVTLTPVTVPNGLTLNPDGTVTVAPNTPAGTYPVVYQICQIANPTVCDQATATIVVNTIDAVNDGPTNINGIPGGSTPSVLANDTVNGSTPATTSNVTLTPVTVPNGLTLNPDGTITVAPNTPAGTYPVVYQICQIANPAVCDQATATVVVNTIDAVNDGPTNINGIPGGSTPSVLANDTVNGSTPATTSNVTLTPVTVPNGLTLNPDGTVTVAPNTPAGTYPVVYQICQIANPAVCDQATATVVVNTIDAVNDGPTNINGIPGGSTPSVLANDTVNGSTPATTSNVTLTPVTVPNGLTLNPDGTVTVAPNTPAGTYPVVYQICQIANPAVCDQATATVVVNTIDAVNDGPTNINGIPGGSTPSVLANDTVNGSTPATTSNVTLTPVTVPNGLTLNPDGTITVAPNTPAGTYPVVYQICQIANPAVCDQATATIVVNTIDAVNDTIPSTSGIIGNTNAGNVLAANPTNADTLNGVATTISQVTMTVVTPATPIGSGLVPTLNPATGIVSVPAGTPPGTYTITYQICDQQNLSICDTAIVTIPVTGSTLPPFDCSTGLGYLITNSNTASGVNANYISGLQSFNLATTVVTMIDNQLIDTASQRYVNAVGYNLVDNYIYGLREYTNQVVRIGSNGAVDLMPTTGTGLGTSDHFAAGDVSPSGILFAHSNELHRMISINLNPTASDYLVATTRATATTLLFDDFAFSPVNGMVYGVTRKSPTARLFSFNPTTNVFTVIGNINGLSAADSSFYGTAFMDNLGNLFFANNDSGNTYKINTPHLATGAVTATMLTNLSVTPGDGARCPNQEILPVAVADSGCATQSRISSFVVAANDNAGTYPINPLSAMLIDPVTSGQVNSVTIAGQGTFTVNVSTGAINFSPLAGFTGTTVSYVIADTHGNYSSPATLTLTVCPAPSIQITKDGAYADANGDGITNVGDVINYTFVVTNTGNTILTNITVTDNNAVVTGGPLASLAPGASDAMTFTAVHTITAADIAAGYVYNLATATGTTPDGGTVTDTSSDPTPCATCPVDPSCPDCTITPILAPSIQITKDGAYADANGDGITNVGDVINYTFVVTNTGNTILTNITVTDNNAVVTGGPLASLAPGASDATTFTAVHTITAADIAAGYVYNLATATGTTPDGGTVTDTSSDPTPCATCPVDPSCPDCTITPILAPSIQITKDGAYADANGDGITNVGDVINYTFVVTNTGNTILTNITVTDNNAVVTGGPLASLAPGASDATTFTAVHTITAADIAAGYVYNLATATGTTPDGGTVTDTSSDPTPCATCPVDPNCPDCTITPILAPSIQITKDGAYADANGDGITNVGDVINYTFVVTNTGNTILTNITITDNNAVVTGGPLASLAPGASDATTFTAVHTITAADIAAGYVYNLATATGTTPDGGTVTDTSSDPTPCATCPVDPSCPDCTITPILAPSIQITKDGAYADANGDGITNVGDVINYTFVVTNTGNTILTNITVTDNNAVVTGGPLASLAPGASDATTFTAVHTITTADIAAGYVYNLATATGTTPDGGTVTDTSSDPTPCATCPVDPSCPDCTITPILAPSIQITKDGAYADANGDGITNVGDVINYTFVVTNTGNTILTNITVTDNNAVVTGGPLASLAPGASDATTFTAVHTITTADIAAGYVYNLATATGTTPDGGTVTDTSSDPTPCATCPVDPSCPDCTITPILAPSIQITKDGAYADANGDGITNVGDVINYTFVVTNTGNTILTNITVTDNNAVVTGGPLASLAPGASDATTFTAVHTITAADIAAGYVYNLATATGTTPDGGTVTDTSSDPTPCATCPVDPSCPDCTITPILAPSIQITKDGAYADANGDGITNVGDVINYTFVVTNTGNTILTNITVTDNNAVVTGGPLASLAPGASDATTFTAVHTITAADIAAGYVYNLATATGTTPDGGTVTDTSSDPTPCATCPVDPSCPDCTITPILAPSIQITKDGAYADANGDGITNVGDVINYTFVVTNTGNTILTNITVTDNNAVVTGGPLASLAPGASDATTFTAVHTITAADIAAGYVYNLATATGTTPDGGTVTDTSSDPTPCATCPVDPSCPDCTITPIINAVDDSFNSSVCNEGQIIGNILTNDLLGSELVNTAPNNQVSVVVLTGNNPTINIAPNGDITLLSGIAPGTYNYSYSICSTIVPNLCDQAFVTITISQPVQPTLACYETATFNTVTCTWDVTGTQPVQPTLACYETATFNVTTCSWDVTGTQPVQPTLACYETATFNTATCTWDVTGTQPVQPTLACYETATFNTTTCAWDVTGTQPVQPTLACYETATFNVTTCSWNVTGTQPVQPTLACYETATFNTATCAWDVTGTQPVQPTLACYETATFNTATCAWDVSGTQPVQPTLACYETATFNTTTCAWDVTGTQPAQPTLACYETATFNTATCAWDVSGTQPVQPTLACYETATFNTATCAWDVTGTQPVQPTLACYETATFNTATCAWDVSGTQPVQPTLACYETATFNTATCAWDVTGTQPAQPTLACYETATFNTATCTWDVTGTQPAQPTLACYETATFNTTTCAWDVTGTQPILAYQLDRPVCNGDVSLTVNAQDIIDSQFPGVATTNGTWSINPSNGGLNTVNGIFTPFGLTVGNYVITYNNNDSICPTIVEISITVDEDCFPEGCGSIIIHNAFTPNNDGLNEWFQIDNIESIGCYPTNNVEIYNRWGVLVYETKDYNNTTRRFEGISEGRVTINKEKELPTGTYFYIISYKTTEGNTITKDGYLYLTR